MIYFNYNFCKKAISLFLGVRLWFACSVMIVPDAYHERARLLTTYAFPSNNNIVSTLAGNGESNQIDGIGESASFKEPFGITSDYYNTGDFLYVTDKAAQSIRKINRITKEVTTLNLIPTNGTLFGSL